MLAPTRFRALVDPIDALRLRDVAQVDVRRAKRGVAEVVLDFVGGDALSCELRGAFTGEGGDQQHPLGHGHRTHRHRGRGASAGADAQPRRSGSSCRAGARGDAARRRSEVEPRRVAPDRAHHVEPGAWLARVAAAQARMDCILALAASGRTFSPAELLSLQAGVAEASQTVDLAGKVLDRVSGGVKTRCSRRRSSDGPAVRSGGCRSWLALLGLGPRRGWPVPRGSSTGWTERAGNEIQTVLLERGFRARKVVEDGRPPTWAVEVESADAADAVRVLAELGLPRARPAGVRGAAEARAGPGRGGAARAARRGAVRRAGPDARGGGRRRVRPGSPRPAAAHADRRAGAPTKAGGLPPGAAGGGGASCARWPTSFRRWWPARSRASSPAR